jgi:two-component system, NarL family, invasion response regulator UvrY
LQNNEKHIIIADDHAVVRTGLQLILDETHDMRVVDEAGNGDELLEKLGKSSYDIVVLDMTMPGKDTTDVLKEINLKWPQVPVVIFSMNADDAFALRMLANGASAYINKESQPNELIRALRTVAKGQRYLNARQSELMLNSFASREEIGKLPHEELSDREFQVFCLLAMGLRNSEMAQKLDISKNTVSNHRNNILKKMGFAGNSDLTRYALQHGFIQ